MGYPRAKRIVGGGQETTSRMQAVAAAIWELKDESAGWHWVTFESDGSANVIEIARDHMLRAHRSREFDCALVNIPHQEREGLLPWLAEVGLDLPRGWVVDREKKRGFLRRWGYLQLRVEPEYQDGLRDFVEEAGLKLFGWDQTKSITCSLQQ